MRKFSFIIILLINLTILYTKPQVIPEVKEWTPNNSFIDVNSQYSIVCDTYQSDKLLAIANTLYQDVFDLNNWKLNIKQSNVATLNSIFLKIDSTISPMDEYYTIDISNNKIIIKGRNDKGVFWATRTLLQLLKQSYKLEGGTIIDYPDYKERGLMVDVARRYYSMQWLKNHIKELSYLKMNIFHLHLSDNEGFRLECETYPQITSKDHYTKKQILELEDLAKKYYVEIIPEIDMPAHVSSIVKHFPELELIDKYGNTAGDALLDIVKDTARVVLKNIINEYLDLFKGKYWHFGADEYITDYSSYPHIKIWAENKYGVGAIAEDAYCDLINWANEIVRAKGKILRICNDWTTGLSNKKTKTFIANNIAIDYWLDNDFNINNFIDNDFKIMNCSVKYMYYVLSNSYINNEQVFNEWNTLNFSSFDNERILDNSSNILGAKFQVWSDISDKITENEYQTGNTIKKVLRIVSLNTWNLNHTKIAYKDFNDLITIIGRAPGFEEDTNPFPNNLAYKKAIFASSVEPNSTDLYPELANDGDQTTRWASALTDSEWIYIDFGSKTKFTTVRLNWEYAYATNYALQVSDDAISWKNIYETTDGKGSLEIINNLDAESRFLKIDLRKRVAWNGYSLWEIEVLDSNKISSYNTNTVISLISPNPALDYININIDPLNLYSPFQALRIYNIFGILINEYNVIDGKNQFNISHLPPGVYFVIYNKRIEKLIKL